MYVEFRDKILLRGGGGGGGGGGGECETLRKSNFSEKWQNGNFGQNPKFL